MGRTSLADGTCGIDGIFHVDRTSLANGTYSIDGIFHVDRPFLADGLLLYTFAGKLGWNPRSRTVARWQTTQLLV